MVTKSIQSAVPARPFACPQTGCDKTFARQSTRLNHINAIHNNLRLTCPTCHKEFNYRDDLRKHIGRVHELKRPFVCTKEPHSGSACACGKAFATRGDLNRHQRKSKGMNATEVAISSTDDFEHQDVIFASDGTSLDSTNHVLMSHAGHEAVFTTQKPCTSPDISLMELIAPDSMDDLDHDRIFGWQVEPTWSPSAALCRSMAPLCSLARSEQHFLSIQIYITGTFEAGVWVSTGQDFLCTSIKCNTSLQMHDLSGEMAFISRALRGEQYQLATSSLYRLCQSSETLLQGQSFLLLWDLLLLAAKYSSPLRVTKAGAERQSLGVLVRHLLDTSLIFHGRYHPLSRILRTVCNAVHVGTDSHDEVLRALSVVQDSYERKLGADHLVSLRTKLELSRQTSAMPMLLLEMLKHWEHRGGFGSERMRVCLKFVLFKQREYCDYQGLHESVEYVDSRFHHIKDKELRCRYAKIMWRAVVFAYLETGQPRLAAETIRTRLLPETVSYYGEAHPKTVEEWWTLKRCLVESGDQMQVKGIDNKVRHLQRRLEHGQRIGNELF